mgnify:CR=1 FL=1
MGSLNSRNQIYIDNGINYRKAIKGINSQLVAAQKSDDPNAKKAYDLLLAKKAFLSAHKYNWY